MVELYAVLSQVNVSRQKLDRDLQDRLRGPGAFAEHAEAQLDGQLLSGGDGVELLLVVVADAVLGDDGLK